MISVYSGFEEINETCLDGEVSKGSILGSLNKKSTEIEEDSTKKQVLPKKDFEFQIIDIRNTVVINPFLLLSKLEKISPVFSFFF